MMKTFLPLIVLILIATSTSDASIDTFFEPHANKHHVYRSCGETLMRRVSYLCAGGFIRKEVLNALECCSVGCTDKQLFSWCDV